jgi:hypothetical protein
MLNIMPRFLRRKIKRILRRRALKRSKEHLYFRPIKKQKENK